MNGAAQLHLAFDVDELALAQARGRGDPRRPAEGIVTEDLSEDAKSYKTSEVGDWLATNI